MAPIGYIFAVYTLIVLVVFLIFGGKKRLKKAKEKILKLPLINRFLTDVKFKTKITLTFSLIMNLIFIGLNILSSILSGSPWFCVLAFYYSILAFMRFTLLRYFVSDNVGKNLMAEHKRSLLCGSVMLLLNLSLLAALFLIIYQNKGYEYKGILIYIMVVYTFIITAQSVTNLIKYRKRKTPIIFTAKVISLSAALTSVLAIQTAMLARFGAQITLFLRRIVISVTGGGVVVAELIMSAYLIIHSLTEIKRLKNKVRLK